ncbi:MAG TPA: hypothetical protein VGB95_05230, partial [Chitinophagales bacterium]
YLLIVGSATYDDIYLQWKVNQYDLNKDGLFSGIETTPELNQAMKDLINDTGRNFSFITGFIFALILSIATYFVSKISIRIKQPS